MNAPSASSRRAAASPTQSTGPDSTLVPMPSDSGAAANDDTEPIEDSEEDTERIVESRTVNPLWMITIALGFFFAALAVLIST